MWLSGALPGEFADFCLMEAMGWSWAELEATPAYVRRYCADILGLRNQAREAAAKEVARRAR